MGYKKKEDGGYSFDGVLTAMGVSRQSYDDYKRKYIKDDFDDVFESAPQLNNQIKNEFDDVMGVEYSQPTKCNSDLFDDIFG